jgi:hypothetical protein
VYPADFIAKEVESFNMQYSALCLHQDNLVIRLKGTFGLAIGLVLYLVSVFVSSILLLFHLVIVRLAVLEEVD